MVFAWRLNGIYGSDGMDGKDGYEKLENGRWGDRWRDKLEGQKCGTGGTKLLPEHTVRGGSKKPKKGD